jgi:hypothetical protein
MRLRSVRSSSSRAIEFSYSCSRRYVARSSVWRLSRIASISVLNLLTRAIAEQPVSCTTSSVSDGSESRQP